MNRLTTPAGTADYNAKLFAILYPHGYTPPPTDPLEALPRLTIQSWSVLDQDLDDAASKLAYLSIRGRRSVPSLDCEHERSDLYWTAVAETASGGFSVAESFVDQEPVVAALVVEIFFRASTRFNLAPANLRAQVEMQMAAVDAARSLQRLVPTAEQVKLLSLKQASLLH